MAQGVEAVAEPMGFQDGTRRCELVLLCQSQGAQQVIDAGRNVALGKPLEKNLRSLGLMVEEGSGGGEQQDEAIAWLRVHRLLGERQEPGLALRIGEGAAEDFVPPNGLRRRIADSVDVTGMRPAIK